VRGTNLCHLGLAVDEAYGHVVLSSAIDNLVKGASGQAVQAMNCVLGLDEGTALRGGLL
jgi:N-acetyl-gamma-glutamyl-phosphate reductase